MLVSFKVRNYLSFKEEAGFSMEASSKKFRTLPNNKSIITLKDGENIWINKTAIFYGANASGKTNILKGLNFLKFITLNSFQFGIEGGIKNEISKIEKTQGNLITFDRFLLDRDSLDQDIFFEIEFLIEKSKYKYFLKLNEKEVTEEKLFIFEGLKEKILINRKIDNSEVNITIEETYFGFEAQDFNKLNLFPRNNQTFISVLADRDSKGSSLATGIIKFFRGLNFIDSSFDLTGLTLPMLEKQETKTKILNFITNADINIEDIKQEVMDFIPSNNLDLPFIEINGQRVIPNKIIETNFIHPIYKDTKKVGSIGFNLGKQESLGTKRLFGLLGPILETIQNNGILLIDEIDTHMHFLLIENLIKVIHGLKEDGKNNIGAAQFIFNTHNLDLMDLELFKKDQIFFTSKDNYGATEIYSLDDFKDIQIRNNSDIKKAYKLGIFGAIPLLSDFSL